MADFEYFVSFRVAEEWTPSSPNDRRQTIYDAIKDLDDLWDESTSFLIFRASTSIKEVLEALVAGLDEDHDMMLIRRVGYKETYFWGSIIEDTKLVDLVPEARRLTF